MEIAKTVTGVHGVQVSNASIMIIKFVLSSLAKEGTPAKVLYTTLQGCFTMNPHQLKFVRVKFDINTEDLELHEEVVNNLIQTLNE